MPYRNIAIFIVCTHAQFYFCHSQVRSHFRFKPPFWQLFLSLTMFIYTEGSSSQKLVVKKKILNTLKYMFFFLLLLLNIGSLHYQICDVIFL